MRKFTQTLLFLALVLNFATAKAQQHSIVFDPDAPVSKVRHTIEPSRNRWCLALGTGVMPQVLSGGKQTQPVLQATAHYLFTSRLSVGLAYGQTRLSPKPYIDDKGVKSYESNFLQNVGLRMQGNIVSTGTLELYGGLQIGITSTESTYRHEFPASLVYESEAAYLASRPSPFFPQPSQVGAIGFLGIAVRVLPHVHAYAELGNNLALLSGGAQLRF